MAIDSRLLDCASIPQVEENFDRVLAGADALNTRVDALNTRVDALNTRVDALKVCRVTFDSDGGSSIAEQLLINGNAIAEPTDPTKEGYTFDGWFSGEDEWDFETALSGDVTLTAHWTEIPTEP